MIVQIEPEAQQIIQSRENNAGRLILATCCQSNSLVSLNKQIIDSLMENFDVTLPNKRILGTLEDKIRYAIHTEGTSFPLVNFSSQFKALFY